MGPRDRWRCDGRPPPPWRVVKRWQRPAPRAGPPRPEPGLEDPDAEPEASAPQPRPLSFSENPHSTPPLLNPHPFLPDASLEGVGPRLAPIF
eukprot:tig00020553_g10505.t1